MLARAALAVSCCALYLALGAVGAAAADRVYWTSYGTNAISYANLDGSGGGDVDVGGATIHKPSGIALNPAANRVYWTNYDNGGATDTIGFANLDGSAGAGNLDLTGASRSVASGLAVDPAANRVYWSNQMNSTISYANLDGSGGGDDLAGVSAAGPNGLALDPAADRIYWTNQGDNTIAYAGLDGSGTTAVGTGSTTPNFPTGIALDPAANRMYWGNQGDNTISYANLDGSGGDGAIDMSGAATGLGKFPHGIAIDPGANRIYWANGVTGGTVISYTNLDGGGDGHDLSLAGATPGAPEMLALLKAPAGSGSPQISGGSMQGATLTCAPGTTWAGDLPGAQLYRAPTTTSIEWTRDGATITGAGATTLTADAAGAYRCLDVATNAAGSTSSASAAVQVAATPPSNRFRFGPLKRNLKRGTAILTVIVPGPGILRLRGKWVAVAHATRRVGAARRVRLVIGAKGKARRTLRHRGRVKLRVRVAFTPNGGTTASRTKTVGLKRRR